ncbi:MAG TPA: TetR/AcrR family transcriptional regulator [Parvularculaceae bacterium]|nr:TetR/AcrR family transcriptional regulator [Parvularculaceae bacterium]
MARSPATAQKKPAKIKTRERILTTSLALFNSEGEAQVSTVDIAAVLGISPGNLYYHFKGKEAIIEALFDEFEIELRQVLSASIDKPLSLEDNWIFVYIIFEEINDFRFFYEGMSSILERCPSLRGRLARLLALKKATTLAILTSLEKQKLVAFLLDEKDRLADRIAAHLTFWLQYRAVTEKEQTDRARIHDGVYSTILQIAPFVVAGREDYLAGASAYFARQGAKK